jgi:general secretion pathway protein A
MYTEYFGFREKPFSITPDPRFFYTNPRYQQAYASLLYGIRERRGFMVLTGEIGTGKTTLLHRLMAHMGSRIRFVFFSNTTVTFEEILDFVCRELELPIREPGRVHKIQLLNEFLLDQLTVGKTVALLIDEAQNLGDEVLEHLRLLSNLETTTDKLLQIVLVGQPELESKLGLHALRQLRQRIAMQCRLEQLDHEEVGPFIYYRLHAIGYKRQQLFPPEAIEEIASYSQGFPRLINVLCDNALLIAYASSQRSITPAMVREAAEDLRLVKRGGASPPGAMAKVPTRQSRVRQSLGGVHLGKALAHGTVARSGRRALRLAVVVGLLAMAGVSLYAWRVETGMLESLSQALRGFPHTLHGVLSGRMEEPGAAEPPLETLPQRAAHEPLAEASGGRGPAAAAAPRPIELPTEGKDTDAASEPRRGAGGDLAPSMAGRAEQATEPGPTATELTGWREKPLTVQPGSTVAEIAANMYGVRRDLGLDLIKEYNPHIDNLNRIVAGQKLWLPPLSREVLVRQQPDGSYHLILATFRTPQQSAQLVRITRPAGYDVVVTPQRVSDDLTLYRVEISGLGTIEAVNQAWEIASANQWIAFVENRSGR